MTDDESAKEAITDLDDLSTTIWQMTKDGRFQISLKDQVYDAIFDGSRKTPICTDGEIAAVNETMCRKLVCNLRCIKLLLNYNLPDPEVKI